MDTWRANDVHPISRAALAGVPCYGGLDLGSVSDITAWALLCECPHDADAIDVLMRFWVPADALSDPANRNADLYRVWSETIVDGVPLLDTTPGAATDYDFIEAAILGDADVYAIKTIGLDRLFQGQQIANHLMDHGLTIAAIGQGFLGQGPPMKEFERRWRQCRIHHGGHPVLRWMADNVEVKQDPAGNLKIIKPNSRHDPRKVDGIQAIVNGLDQLARATVDAPAVEPDVFVLGR